MPRTSLLREPSREARRASRSLGERLLKMRTLAVETRFQLSYDVIESGFQLQEPNVIASPRRLVLASLALAACVSACNGSNGDSSANSTSSSTGTGGADSLVYDLPSAFSSGKSAIVHDGQSLRNVLITDMIATIEGLTARIDEDAFSPKTVEETVLLLEHYYAFDSQTAGMDAPMLATSPKSLQSAYDAIATGKSLKPKLAGNDKETDHKDWATKFVGWKDASIAANGGSITSPEGLLYAYFNTLGKLALDRENGTIPVEPGTSKPIAVVHITPDGLDLHELIEKLLELGIGYSQATDDYLDDDLAGKGLLSPNTQDGTEPYTVLGHAWDEAFGYFGAARDYAAYTDEELASTGGRPDWQEMHDTNGDGAIDLTREINFGIAITAAKRDLNSKDGSDFTGEAFAAALAGRRVIQGAGTTLTDAELSALKGHRDTWRGAWERALAATVIHELNESISLTQEVGTAKYDFYEHAGEWSEMKGYALGLQFNPKKTITDADFAKLHELIGDKPAMATATQAARDAYVASLQAARELVRVAYGFSKANAEAW